MDEFVRGDYSDAVKSFQRVLKVDPAADRSRALAIAGYLEIGETNMAVELAKGFKSPTGRWAQWAAAKAELETGSVSNSTVECARLARENPTMWTTPKEGVQLWRKMDVRLFRQLISKAKP